MTDKKYLIKKSFALYLLVGGLLSVPILKASDLAESPETLSAIIQFTKDGTLLPGQDAQGTRNICYNWARDVSQATSQKERILRTLLQAKLLNDVKNQYDFPEGRDRRDEATDCLGMLHDAIDIDVRLVTADRIRLQNHGRIWYGQLAARFELKDFYKDAWNFLKGVDTDHYTRTAKLWQAHLIIRNSYWPTDNRDQALTIAETLLNELQPRAGEPRSTHHTNLLLEDLNKSRACAEKDADCALSDPKFLGNKESQFLLKALGRDLIDLKNQDQGSDMIDFGYFSGSDSGHSDGSLSESSSSSYDSLDHDVEFSGRETPFNSSSSSSSSSEQRGENQKKILTNQQKEDIREYVRDGKYNYVKMAEKVGCTLSQIRYFLNKEGLTKKTPRITKQEKQDVQSLRVQGKNNEEIARFLDITMGRVASIVKKLNIARSIAAGMTPEQDLFVVNLKLANPRMTDRELSKASGFTEGQARGALKRYEKKNLVKITGKKRPRE